MKSLLKCGELSLNTEAKVVRLLDGKDSLLQRLSELGFNPGEKIKVILEAPFSKDPIALSVRGTVIALRRQEANLIEVETL